MPLAGYQFDTESALQLVALGASILSYLAYRRRAATLAEHGRPVPEWREWCFIAGLVLLLAVLSPPADSWSDKLFSAHMAQHLAIGDFSALLLVLGMTGPMMQPILHIKVIDRLRFLTNPIPAVTVWALNFYTWHLPFMYKAAYENDLIHAVQHLSFLIFGAIMWMPLFGPLPKPAWFNSFAKLGYIITVRLLGTLLANVFIWSGTVFYTFYAAGEAHASVSPLTDQSIAGAVMMLEESILTIFLFGWLFMRAAAESEEKQDLLDWAHSRGFELSPQRAGRAVAAGRGAELRERLERDAGARSRAAGAVAFPAGSGAAASAGSARSES
ncbi:MAG TPA: cytochrome c oxidase assembly protein [Thermoleophilaceae bacterium]|nr:cytochrome c oxidase assembly protein [Thermoleophilaceae bacterium]